METNKTVILSSDFLCEVAFPAIYHCLNESSESAIMTITNAKIFEKTLDAITKVCTNPSCIIMIGTYWQDCLLKLLNHFHNAQFYIHTFGASFDVCSKNLIVCGNEQELMPWFLDLVSKDCLSKSLFNLFVNTSKNILKYINDRIYNRNIVDNQVFFTGLINFVDPITQLQTKSMYEKYIDVLEGNYDIAKILDEGKSIVGSQIFMTNERVLKNSKRVDLKNGVKAVVTEGTELVGLTHDSLHEKYPDAQVSIVLRMDLSVIQDKLVYSIRAYDNKVCASKLVENMKGGGNDVNAGGKIDFVFPLPF